jgi:hypothetical protein
MARRWGRKPRPPPGRRSPGRRTPGQRVGGPSHYRETNRPTIAARPATIWPSPGKSPTERPKLRQSDTTCSRLPWDATVLGPGAYEAIMTTKAEGSGTYMSAVPMTTSPPGLLWGRPVAIAAQMPANQALVGSFSRGGRLYLRGGASRRQQRPRGFLHAHPDRHSRRGARGTDRLAAGRVRARHRASARHARGVGRLGASPGDEVVGSGRPAGLTPPRQRGAQPDVRAPSSHGDIDGPVAAKA